MLCCNHNTCNTHHAASVAGTGVGVNVDGTLGDRREGDAPLVAMVRPPPSLPLPLPLHSSPGVVLPVGGVGLEVGSLLGAGGLLVVGAVPARSRHRRALF